MFRINRSMDNHFVSGVLKEVTKLIKEQQCDNNCWKMEILKYFNGTVGEESFDGR